MRAKADAIWVQNRALEEAEEEEGEEEDEEEEEYSVQSKMNYLLNTKLK